MCLLNDQRALTGRNVSFMLDVLFHSKVTKESAQLSLHFLFCTQALAYNVLIGHEEDN